MPFWHRARVPERDMSFVYKAAESLPMLSWSLRRWLLFFLLSAGEPDVQAQGAFFRNDLAFDFRTPARGGAAVVRLELHHDLSAEEIAKVRWVEGLTRHDRRLMEAHQACNIAHVPRGFPFEVGLEEKADVPLARQGPDRLARHFMMMSGQGSFRLNARDKE